MKLSSLLSTFFLFLLLASAFLLFPHSIQAAECGDDQSEAKPGESCNDGSGGELKTCCSEGGKRYICEPDGPATVGGLQDHKCKPDSSDPNNNGDPKKSTKNDCIDTEQKGPCANNKDCCSTDKKQLVCYSNRNGGKGLCDLPNQDANDRTKKAEKRDQNCVDKEKAKCEGNGGAQDCCKKTNKEHKDFECIDKDKKATDGSGTCGYVDINTGAECLKEGAACKGDDWKCCGEMGCVKGKCQEGLNDPPSPPCAEGQFKDGKCMAVATALGNFSTQPEGFIKSLFAALLSLSGGIALLLIMKSGYLIMTANGKPEAIQSGRDQLVAAIVGLIFLIFSFVILQVIGVDILKIPGWK
jgi:hypothetical protein